MSIPAGNSRALCEVLDGVAERGACGYSAITDDRMLWIPFRVAACPATALVICRSTGLLRSKLDAMNDADANYVYFTTLATATPEN
jgi:hypothetical protein